MGYSILGLCLSAILGGLTVFLIFYRRILSDRNPLTFSRRKKKSPFHDFVMQDLDMSEYDDVTKAVESELKLMGFDLHDEILPFLSSTNLGFQIISSNENISDDGKETIASLQHKCIQTELSLRRIIDRMIPQSLERGNLTSAIHEFCLKHDGLRGRKILFETSGEPVMLPSKYQLHIFRICQQLINNAIEHSFAWNIQVFLLWKMKELKLIVKDDGRGMVDTEPKLGKFGISGILFRARMIEAEAKFKNPKQGVEFELSVPLGKR